MFGRPNSLLKEAAPNGAAIMMSSAEAIRSGLPTSPSQACSMPGIFRFDTEYPVKPALGLAPIPRSEEHTSELQSHSDLVCRLLLEKKIQCPHSVPFPHPLSFFFFNDTATTEIYTLSLHDALPIWRPTARQS